MTREEKNRIGVLGGTFNPVHLGHLILAEQAREQYELSRVLLIPCARPPHKEPGSLAPEKHRLGMLSLALEHDLYLESSDIEIRRGPPSYSVDTMRELENEFPGAEFFFIIGADSLFELHTWKDIDTLLDICTFVSFGRPGSDVERMSPGDLGLERGLAEKVIRHVHRGRLIDISSSEIRYRIAEGLSIRYLVPCEVDMYICEHRLYR
jgi:nicotinate-nucleotide adenylyltransferase